MKKSLVAFFLIIFATCSLAQTPATLKVVNPLTDSVVNYSKTFLGTPYVYACASSAGFDCSGFTWYVFNHYHIVVPRSSKDYKTFGTEIPIDQARKGDIIVFRGTHPSDKSAGHVGIVITNPGEPLQFIHSSSSKNHEGVVITDYKNSAYPGRFIKIVRVIE
ncbi:MAG: C40 family peptidase [Bacteroidia bacterium]